MLASERLLEIEEKFDATVERIVPVELDGETIDTSRPACHCELARQPSKARRPVAQAGSQ